VIDRLPFNDLPERGETPSNPYRREHKPTRRRSAARPASLSTAPLRPPVRVTDPDTSRAAAFALDPSSLMARVYNALLQHGPMADFQLAAAMGLQEGSVRKRRSDLTAQHLVEDTGRRIEGPSGCKRIIWRVAG